MQFVKVHLQDTTCLIAKSLPNCQCLLPATRYDLAFYTYTGNNTLDPIFGESCAVDILGEDDQIIDWTDGAENGVYDMDGD